MKDEKETKTMIPKMKSNFGSGPRMGNASARPGKRETFAEGKAERSALADQVTNAYAHRSWERAKTTHDPMLEPVNEEVRVPKRFKK